MSRTQSQRMKERWQNPEQRRKMLEGRINGAKEEPKAEEALNWSHGPKCLHEGRCFGMDSRGRCIVLTEADENCSFFKTPEQAKADAERAEKHVRPTYSELMAEKQGCKA